MFELFNILKMYRAYMLTGARGLMPHGYGPPGAGKTWAVEKAANMLGVNLHVINVSRLSPLEIEGLQMPVEGNTKLEALTATFWTRIKPGDIVLFDEFLRGFPEVYNALLDLFTSRKVGDFQIPESFWIAASNSIATYDPALEDRLLHLPVPDPRTMPDVDRQSAKTIVSVLGLRPNMEYSQEMTDLLRAEVHPTYLMLDKSAKTTNKNISRGMGVSVRNLIAQAQLRQVRSKFLRALIETNNVEAEASQEYQHLFLVKGIPTMTDTFEGLLKSDRLTELQRKNTQLNLELSQMEANIQVNEIKEEEKEDDPF